MSESTQPIDQPAGVAVPGAQNWSLPRQTIPLYTTVEQVVVALVGNPNTGKTSLFNALTGFRRHVANYPGVTVEVARGPVRDPRMRIELLDLPGTYSLTALSPDEMLVSDVLAGRVAHQPRPDAILAIVDASNLRRNLYLVSQLLEFDLPLIVAVNMIDVARRRGIRIDCDLISRRLGVPVVPIVATRPDTLAPLITALGRVRELAPSPERAPMPEPIRAAIAALDVDLTPAEKQRLLLDEEGYAQQRYLDSGGPADLLERARGKLRDAGVDGSQAEVQARYTWIASVLDGAISRSDRPIVTFSERLDRVLTHRFAGVLVLLAVLFALFQSVFTWAGPIMDAIDGGFAAFSDWIGPLLPAGALRSLVTDGLIAGVGGVLVFLPQILILFAIIAILEDCGYLARAAYMMDRLMRALGLSGRAFIPLLSSFACAVPAIMGSRTIGDRRERFTTILIAPFMSCSARLPVYVLMISAFVPPTTILGGYVRLQAAVMFVMYLVGVCVAIPFAWLLRRTALRGPTPGFVLELPSYKWPRPRAVLQRMLSAGRHFVTRAGTIIVAVNLVVWALGYFPHSPATATRVQQQAAEAGWDAQQTASELAGAYLRDSYLGTMGRAIEPVVAPIGWDWRIGMATIASFPAREVVIATLGTIFNLGSDQDEQSTSLRTALLSAHHQDGRRVFSLPVALSLMVFFALCAQCSATLVTIARETRSYAWPLASFTIMTSVAYIAALLTSWTAQAAGL